MLYMFDLDGTLIESYLEEVTCPKCHGRRTDPFTHASTTQGDNIALPCEQCRGKGTWLKLTESGYDEVNWLPGRLDRLQEIAARGDRVAICTNQTGVHWGYQTKAQVDDKLSRVVRDIDAPYMTKAYACYKPGPMRKPAPGMLFLALQDHRSPAWASVYVGDMETDEVAASRAGVPFCWAHTFFEGPTATPGPIPDRFKTVQYAEERKKEEA